MLIKKEKSKNLHVLFNEKEATKIIMGCAKILLELYIRILIVTDLMFSRCGRNRLKNTAKYI